MKKQVIGDVKSFVVDRTKWYRGKGSERSCLLNRVLRKNVSKDFCPDDLEITIRSIEDFENAKKFLNKNYEK